MINDVYLKCQAEAHRNADDGVRLWSTRACSQKTHQRVLSKIDAQNVLLHHCYDDLVNVHLDDKKFLISQ